MRTHLALAATLLALLAVPARAQSGQPPFHGNGFEIALPAGYPPMMSQHTSDGGQDMEISTTAKGEQAALLVFHLRMDDIATVDTTIATRRALLQLARAGMTQAEADMQVTGDAHEVTRDDRVAMRMPVKMDAQGEPATGWVEVSIPRRGPVSMWMVMTITTTPTTGDAAAAEQLMDSFRLTGGATSGFLPPSRQAEHAR